MKSWVLLVATTCMVVSVTLVTDTARVFYRRTNVRRSGAGGESRANVLMEHQDGFGAPMETPESLPANYRNDSIQEFKDPNVTDMKAHEAPNWFYVHVNEKHGVVGYSIRLSEKLMLMSMFTYFDERDRHTAVNSVHNILYNKQVFRTDLVENATWYRRPRYNLENNVTSTLMNFVQFKPTNADFPFHSPTNGVPLWKAEDLTINEYLQPGRQTYKHCYLMTHRLLADVFLQLTRIRVFIDMCWGGSVSCNFKTRATWSLPYPQDPFDPRNHSHQIELYFCPEDNGAPIMCDGRLTFMVSWLETRPCGPLLQASFVPHIRPHIISQIQKIHDRDDIFV